MGKVSNKGFWGIFSEKTEKRSSTVSNVNLKLWGDELRKIFGGKDIEVAATSVNARCVPVVFAAIDLIAKTMAQLPLVLYKEGKDGSKERATDHDLYRKLNRKPNKEQTAFTVRYALVANALLYGNGYLLIKKNKFGKKFLYPVDSSRVDPRVNADGDIEYFVKEADGENSVYTTDEVVHIPWSSLGAVNGSDTLTFIKDKIGLALSLTEFGKQFFKNAINSNIAITFPTGLSNEAVQRLRKDLEERYSGVKNTGKPLVLEDQGKVERLELNLMHAQYVEVYKDLIKDIARFFGVPAHKLGILDNATFSNIEIQNYEFVENTLIPWGVKIEQEINSKLLEEKEQNDGLYFKHNMDSLRRGATKDRMDSYQVAVNNRIMTPNEVRRLEDLPPMEGGDELYGPMNTPPINTPPADPAASNTKGATK
jgi:HK97 family phage portal protein